MILSLDTDSLSFTTVKFLQRYSALGLSTLRPGVRP